MVNNDAEVWVALGSRAITQILVGGAAETVVNAGALHIVLNADAPARRTSATV
jgi:hypothetical protein